MVIDHVLVDYLNKYDDLPNGRLTPLALNIAEIYVIETVSRQ